MCIKFFYQKKASFLSLECDFSFYLHGFFWVPVAGDFFVHLCTCFFKCKIQHFIWLRLINKRFGFQVFRLVSFLTGLKSPSLVNAFGEEKCIFPESDETTSTLWLLFLTPLPPSHHPILFVPVFFSLYRCFLHTSLSRFLCCGLVWSLSG